MAPYKSGFVNHILPQSYVDGPGNRAVLFLQGCNFHCKYCHNPFTINQCTNCGECVGFCLSGALSVTDGQVVWVKEKCTGCDACIKSCQYFSSPKVTKMTAAEVWQIIQKNTTFISGISVSGGEPALQIPFLADFFNLVKEESNLTTLIETNGFAGPNAYLPLLPVLDLAMVDLKSADPQAHRELTAQPLVSVLDSIKFLFQEGKLHAVQQVIVPGITDSEASMIQTASMLREISADIRLKLLKIPAAWDSGRSAILGFTPRRTHGIPGQPGQISWDCRCDPLAIILEKNLG